MAKAAPLDASLLGVPKGAAAPAPEPGSAPPAPDPAPDPARAPSRQRAPAPQPRRPPPIVAPPPSEEPRTALTVRLPVSTQERLREAAFRLRMEKQNIVDDAVRAWLEERGY